jgi:hypothetical protein
MSFWPILLQTVEYLVLAFSLTGSTNRPAHKRFTSSGYLGHSRGASFSRATVFHNFQSWRGEVSTFSGSL